MKNAFHTSKGTVAMKYNTFIITCSNQSIIETEILYSVAAARAEGKDFLKLMISSDENEKAIINALTVDMALGCSTRIELYIVSDELQGNSTEAEYLHNKYPKITDICSESETSLIVKI